LPAGLHLAEWKEFASRFGTSSPRRLWLLGRLQAVLAIASSTRKLRRVFVWGSFVTIKASLKDIDVLLILDDDFEVEHLPSAAQCVFDSVRAKLMFDSDVFWARASIGKEALDLWLDTYQFSRDLRRRGIVELEPL
jgi:predicted nucleotidyltransferase